MHTVGPVGEHPEKLESCYNTCLDLVEKYGIKSVAFCGISTGIFGFPLYPASRIAIETVRKWLESGEKKNIERIIFCTFLPKEKECYEKLMQIYFPTSSLQEGAKKKQQEGKKLKHKANYVDEMERLGQQNKDLLKENQELKDTLTELNSFIKDLKQQSVKQGEDHEIDFDHFKINEIGVLGEGSFGTVYKGMYYKLPVAVKKLRTKHSKQSLDDFHNEIQILMYIS